MQKRQPLQDAIPAAIIAAKAIGRPWCWCISLAEEKKKRFALHWYSTSRRETMSIPSTLVTGTIAYLVLGIVLIGIIFSARSVGKLSKDDAAYVKVHDNDRYCCLYFGLVAHIELCIFNILQCW